MINELQALIEKKQEVYAIKDEINRFGISNDQLYMLLYLLSLEIENCDDSKELVNLILKQKPDILVLNHGETKVQDS